MANETSTETGTNRTELARFEPGEQAVDRKSSRDDRVFIVGSNGKTAEETYIAVIGQTVADANPTYSAHDPVAKVVFVETIEAELGTDWSPDDVFEMKEDQVKTYAYPESRLAPIGSQSYSLPGALAVELATSSGLDGNNDLEYLAALVGEAARCENFENDTERARWAVAQWCQETDYLPNLMSYEAGDVVRLGTVPPNDEERLSMDDLEQKRRRKAAESHGDWN